MLKIWTEEFLSVSTPLSMTFYAARFDAALANARPVFTSGLLFQTISRLDPKFIALHSQEVGGKNYEQSMRHVEDFVR